MRPADKAIANIPYLIYTDWDRKNIGGEMMTQEKIDRINELARLAKERELTEEETAERNALRREYIDSVKASLIGQLDNTYIVDEKGNKTPLNKKKNKNKFLS